MRAWALPEAKLVLVAFKMKMPCEQPCDLHLEKGRQWSPSLQLYSFKELNSANSLKKLGRECRPAGSQIAAS